MPSRCVDGLRLETVTYPKTSRVVFYGCGAPNSIADRLSRVDMLEEDSSGSPGTDLTQYSYNGTSRVVISDYQPPDVKLDLFQSTAGTYAGFDRFGRTVRQEWDKYNTGANEVDRVDYSYDLAGDRLTRDVRAELIDGGYPDTHDQKFNYDGLNRLKTFDEGTLASGSIGNPPREQGWILDQLGNWSTFSVTVNSTNTLVQTRTHNAVNEITDITNTTGPAWEEVQQDAAGNIKWMPDPAGPSSATNYFYDAWNRLVEVFEFATYEYDGLGRRIERVDAVANPDITYDDYYNEQWQLLETRAGSSSNPVEQFVWHPYYIDALAVRYWDSNTDGDYADTNEGAHYFCQDANYNVTAVVNASGTVLERYNYTPYGEVTFLEDDFDVASSQVSAIGNTHLYTGRERGPETGLQLNRHRYYASHLGRWLTRDPIGYDSGDRNLYQYLGDSPLVASDPTGFKRPPGHALDWHYCRNKKNKCPIKPPANYLGGGLLGDYANKCTWMADGNYGYHGDNMCFRGLGACAGSQCCYDPLTRKLDDRGADQGTYDYSPPFNPDTGEFDVWGWLGHVQCDVSPHRTYGDDYEDNCTTVY